MILPHSLIMDLVIFVRYQPFTKGEQVDILYITGNPTTDWVRVLMAETPTHFIRKDQISKISHEIQWNPEISQKTEDGRNIISLPAPFPNTRKLGL